MDKKTEDISDGQKTKEICMVISLERFLMDMIRLERFLADICQERYRTNCLGRQIFRLTDKQSNYSGQTVKFFDGQKYIFELSN